MGYLAVMFLALTGVVNSILLVGSIDGLIETPYGRLLLVKIALFLLLVAVALINRFVLTRRIADEARPLAGTSALMWTVSIEQAFGLGILVAASVLGTWPPAMHMQHH
jgi:putative copper resistance protein D